MSDNTDDYDSGYEDGYDAAREATYDEAYKDGEEYGYKDGLETGRAEGLEAGLEEGKEIGAKEAREELENIIDNLNQEILSYRSKIRGQKEQIKELRIANATITRTISESTRDRSLQ